MTGLGLAVVGGRLVWYRFEDKGCRDAPGPRCAATVWAGAAGLASGLLLMTVFAEVPAAPSVDSSRGLAAEPSGPSSPSERPACARLPWVVARPTGEPPYYFALAILGLVNLPMPTRNSWMHSSVDSILSVTRSL